MYTNKLKNNNLVAVTVTILLATVSVNAKIKFIAQKQLKCKQTQQCVVRKTLNYKKVGSEYLTMDIYYPRACLTKLKSSKEFHKALIIEELQNLRFLLHEKCR